MTSSTANCPLCSAATSPAFSTRDLNRGFTEIAFRYRRCRGCGVTYLENVPDDLARYYTTGYHRTPVASELETASAPQAYKLDFIRHRIPAGRIVDIGPSYGAFPHLSRRAGYDVTAIELDADCCSFIENVIGARAIQSAEPHVALDGLAAADVITLWHSLEHLPEPWLTIEAAAANLRPGGLLVVATPNPVGFQARVLKGRWAHVDAPRHLFLIPPAALGARAAAEGLSLIQITSRDEETRRCNRFGWQRAMAILGSPDDGVLTGAALARATAPLERGYERGSAYVAVMAKR